MKATIIETKKQFEPIEIKLVIESAEELCDLWHMLNAHELPQDYICIDSLKYRFTGNGLDLYHFIDELIEKNNLRA